MAARFAASLAMRDSSRPRERVYAAICLRTGMK